jgi:hypothetical protein
MPRRIIVFIVKPPDESSRPSKFTNAETILYEIDMLRFAAHSFGEPDGWSSWRNLECFLIHFRNLIEFFGKPEPRQDDLSIQRPDTIWPDTATRPSAGTLKPLHREDLWDKYEVRSATQVNDKISRYLQHRTGQRVEGKSWRVREMFEELDPLMSEFEKLLPDKRCPWKNPPNPSVRVIGMQHSYSTASPTKATILSTGLNSSPTKNRVVGVKPTTLPK